MEIQLENNRNIFARYDRPNRTQSRRGAEPRQRVWGRIGSCRGGVRTHELLRAGVQKISLRPSVTGGDYQSLSVRTRIGRATPGEFETPQNFFIYGEKVSIKKTTLICFFFLFAYERKKLSEKKYHMSSTTPLTRAVVFRLGESSVAGFLLARGMSTLDPRRCQSVWVSALACERRAAMVGTALAPFRQSRSKISGYLLARGVSILEPSR